MSQMAFDPYKIGQQLNRTLQANCHRSPYYMAEVKTDMGSPRDITPEEILEIQRGISSVPSITVFEFALMFKYEGSIATINTFNANSQFLSSDATVKKLLKEKIVCSKCFVQKAKGVCQGCKVSRYCSKTCQRADWKEHRLFCTLRC